MRHNLFQPLTPPATRTLHRLKTAFTSPSPSPPPTRPTSTSTLSPLSPPRSPTPSSSPAHSSASPRSSRASTELASPLSSASDSSLARLRELIALRWRPSPVDVAIAEERRDYARLVRGVLEPRPAVGAPGVAACACAAAPEVVLGIFEVLEGTA